MYIYYIYIYIYIIYYIILYRLDANIGCMDQLCGCALWTPFQICSPLRGSATSSRDVWRLPGLLQMVVDLCPSK